MFLSENTAMNSVLSAVAIPRNLIQLGPIGAPNTTWPAGNKGRPSQPRLAVETKNPVRREILDMTGWVNRNP